MFASALFPPRPIGGVGGTTVSDRTETETGSDRVESEHGTADYDPNPSERGKWVSAVIALAGLWLIVEAVAFDLVAANLWNDVLVGIALVALAGYNYYRREKERLANTAAAALAALLGLWLVASPFVFGARAGTGAEAVSGIGFWTDVIVGLVALVLGAYSAYESRSAERPAAATR